MSGMQAFSDFKVQQAGGLSFRCSGDGNPIVLLHGFPEDGSSWRLVAPELVGDFKIIIPDFPGTGDSSDLDTPDTIDAVAEAVIAMMVELDISRAVFAGHSMGGYVALAIAERRAAMVAGLALIHSTAAADNDEKKLQRRRSADLLRNGGQKPFVKGAIEALFAPAFKETHPELVQQQTERAMQIKAESLAQFTEAMARRPERKAILQSKQFPVQWVVGDQDGVIPVETVLSQVALPAVSFLAYYKGCGHLSPLEAPHRLASDLRRFAQHAFLP